MVDLVDFREAGYCVLSELISREIVDRLRAHLDACHFSHPGVGLGIFKVIHLPHLDEVVFATKALSAFHDILHQQLSMFPNITVRVDTQAPWHLDEAFRRPHSGWEDGDCDFLQAIVYLQDNGLGGGGLDVVPGSHRLNELAGKVGSVRDVVQHLLAHKQTIESKAGDCAIWDCRLLHRSTQIASKNLNNYGVQWTIAKRTARKSDFLEHLRIRGREKDDTVGVDRRYSEIENFRFLQHAPLSFLQAAMKANIELFDVELQDRSN
jgi:ectoine hydroxylase-related dioxygenase (phytanoyl-CoA dioxygenase family)